MPHSLTDYVLMAGIAVLLVAFTVTVGATLQDHTIGVGDEAPAFSIQTDSGLQISPTSFGGKLLVLNFWATWCPPCLEEMPSLNTFHQSLKDSGVVVLGISVDEDEASYQRILQREQVSFSTARDPEAAISDSFGTYKYPETYVIDATGTVVQKIVGPAVWTDDKMMSYIRSLL